MQDLHIRELSFDSIANPAEKPIKEPKVAR